jgi:hypothetical protein
MFITLNSTHATNLQFQHSVQGGTLATYAANTQITINSQETKTWSILAYNMDAANQIYSVVFDGGNKNLG